MYEYLFTPWRVDKHADNGDIVVRDQEGRIVANCQTDAYTLRMADIQKNASLFAAAPDLLKALEDLVADMEEDQDSGVDEGIYDDAPREDIIKLKALIARAKGEDQ